MIAIGIIYTLTFVGLAYEALKVTTLDVDDRYYDIKVDFIP